jgi:hypothetical protein
VTGQLKAAMVAQIRLFLARERPLHCRSMGLDQGLGALAMEQDRFSARLTTAFVAWDGSGMDSRCHPRPAPTTDMALLRLNGAMWI